MIPNSISTQNSKAKGSITTLKIMRKQNFTKFIKNIEASPKNSKTASNPIAMEVAKHDKIKSLIIL